MLIHRKLENQSVIHLLYESRSNDTYSLTPTQNRFPPVSLVGFLAEIYQLIRVRNRRRAKGGRVPTNPPNTSFLTSKMCNPGVDVTLNGAEVLAAVAVNFARSSVLCGCVWYANMVDYVMWTPVFRLSSMSQWGMWCERDVLTHSNIQTRTYTLPAEVQLHVCAVTQIVCELSRWRSLHLCICVCFVFINHKRRADQYGYTYSHQYIISIEFATQCVWFLWCRLDRRGQANTQIEREVQRDQI